MQPIAIQLTKKKNATSTKVIDMVARFLSDNSSSLRHLVNPTTIGLNVRIGHNRCLCPTCHSAIVHCKRTHKTTSHHSGTSTFFCNSLVSFMACTKICMSSSHEKKEHVAVHCRSSSPATLLNPEHSSPTPTPTQHNSITQHSQRAQEH